MTNRTLVVSIDALITADIPVLRQLPNPGRALRCAQAASLPPFTSPRPCHYCHRLLAGPDWHQQ